MGSTGGNGGNPPEEDLQRELNHWYLTCKNRLKEQGELTLGTISIGTIINLNKTFYCSGINRVPIYFAPIVDARLVASVFENYVRWITVS